MKHDIFVIGASAGGVSAVGELLSALPAEFPGSVFVVVHTSAEGPGTLAKVLARWAPFPAFTAEEGQAVEGNRIYVAPPDRHMLLERGRIRLSRGPTENLHRPAIDPLFRSAAKAYGPAVVGVVLTGYRDDGTIGLQVIKRRGGMAVVQDPDDALVPSMPLNAIERTEVDYKLRLSEIASTLVELADGRGKAMAKTGKGNKSGGNGKGENGGEGMKGKKVADERKPSVFTCPDCHGALWEITERGITHFRCRVGHSYSVESMLQGQHDQVERALWAAVRALEEDAELSQRMADRSLEAEREHGARRFKSRAETSRQNAEVIREILIGEDGRPNMELYTDEAGETAA